jgi:predicted permease
VSDGYFHTIGARVDGREFTPEDRPGAPMVFVVNEAFVRRYFPGRRGVGARLQFGSFQMEIVGVVGDIRQSALAEPAVPTIYVHNLQNSRVKTTLLVRTGGDPTRLANPIREAIWAIDPGQPITSVFTLDEAVSRSLARPRLLVVLLGAFGVVGIVLGAVGLYGIVASLVTDRRRELGVRLALGARPQDMSAMVIRRGLVLAGAGVVTGVAAALAASGWLRAVLFGVEPTDPATFAGTAAVLLATAVVASWVPARRAARLDPVETLRD